MIVPMKKAVLVVQAKDAVLTLEELRGLGLLHIEHQQPPQGRDIQALLEDISVIKDAVGILSEIKSRDNLPGDPELELSDWRFAARHIIDLRKRLNQLEDYSLTLKSIIGQWQAWGDFDPQMIKGLAQRNIYIRLYRIPVKELKNLPSRVILKKILVAAGIANCAIISKEKVDIPFSETALPKSNPEKMRHRFSEDMKERELLKKDILKYIPVQKKFISVRKSLENELVFQKALAGMGQTGSLVYFAGYIPADTLQPLLEAAKKGNWAIAINDPGPEDNVPTLIRNPGWVSLISPVFKMLEVVPGYQELDISLWFLIFFSIFFGILIGDAGYGTIYFILTLLAQRKFGKKLPDGSMFILFYILSACAIIWGVLTATYFGQEWLPQSLRPLIPALRSNKNMQAFCFFIGALHLSIAHFWKAMLKFPSLRMLADIGWVIILWGSFFLARGLVLGDVFPGFGKGFFIAGALLVICFTSPDRNFLKGIANGLGIFLLNVVNTFTDVVSYIRLFAVGLATVAVADAFNKMAIGLGWGSVTAGFLASLALFAGHTLNIILGPLAILVHGVRLNVLEFCGHADIKWSGFSYKPLQKEPGVINRLP